MKNRATYQATCLVDGQTFQFTGSQGLIQDWSYRVRRAGRGDASALSAAIRQHGREVFQLRMLESAPGVGVACAALTVPEIDAMRRQHNESWVKRQERHAPWR